MWTRAAWAQGAVDPSRSPRLARTKLARMGATDPIELASRPASVESLVADLRALGVPSGASVMVHSSLSRLGYVAGGAQAVVMALLEVVGHEGTLVMPTHSGDLSDPAEWRNPPVPAAWWDEIRATMPAYDPRLTPTRAMGAIAECFRHVEGTRRSFHPTVSATALGPNAAVITGQHELAYGLGESSPQARLYDLDGWVLLLGVSHANNTSLHLAEYRSEYPDKRWTTHSSPVLVDGRRQWVSYGDLEEGSGDFQRIGEDFAATGRERAGKVAAATARLCKAQEVVDFGVRWMSAHRSQGA